jgi:hypothetical protein
MPLKDLLKKKDKIRDEGATANAADTFNGPKSPLPSSSSSSPPTVPEFTFVRTTTTTQEVISPPEFPGDREPQRGKEEPLSPRKHGFFKRHSHAKEKDKMKEKDGDNAIAPAPLSPGPTSPAASTHITSPLASPSYDSSFDLQSVRNDDREPPTKRLSQRLHISRNRSNSSTNIPQDLPEIRIDDGSGGVVTLEEREAEWEKRATLLAKGGVNAFGGITGGANVKMDDYDGDDSREGRSSTVSEKGDGDGGSEDGQTSETGRPRARSRSRSVSVSDKGGDENIQEAIRLHETGELEKSTAMFGRLADPKGANNALSQVLYGLALRFVGSIQP